MIDLDKLRSLWVEKFGQLPTPGEFAALCSAAVVGAESISMTTSEIKSTCNCPCYNKGFSDGHEAALDVGRQIGVEDERNACALMFEERGSVSWWTSDICRLIRERD